MNISLTCDFQMSQHFVNDYVVRDHSSGKVIPRTDGGYRATWIARVRIKTYIGIDSDLVPAESCHADLSKFTSFVALRYPCLELFLEPRFRNMSSSLRSRSVSSSVRVMLDEQKNAIR